MIFAFPNKLMDICQL